jgi:hypothetical protein
VGNLRSTTPNRIGHSFYEVGNLQHYQPLILTRDCAEKKPYRRSFLSQVVYYRQSYPIYLVKNCADNVTVPITRSRHVE